MLVTITPAGLDEITPTGSQAPGLCSLKSGRKGSPRGRCRHHRPHPPDCRRVDARAARGL